MDPKLLDKEGRPRVYSTWEYVVNATPQNYIYKVLGYDGATANLSLIAKGGKPLNPPDTGSFNWKRIVAEWKFISNPDPDQIPTLLKKVKNGASNEERMRLSEKAGNFSDAKIYAKRAASFAKADLEMTQEELAVEEKRVIRPEKLEKMSSGDRASLEIRGVRPFVHYLDQMNDWLWYGK